MSGPSDQNVNRIAFCSAVFAGVAYVGYTVVKPFFKKKKSEKKGNFNPIVFARAIFYFLHTVYGFTLGPSWCLRQGSMIYSSLSWVTIDSIKLLMTDILEVLSK